MSDNIPFDIQMRIMKMLPVKSLLQFRSVSKLWKSRIDSSEFIINYHLNNPQLQHRQLIRYEDFEEKYVSVLDDESFPQNKSFLSLPLPVIQLGYPTHFMKVMGSSLGLFCFYNHNRHPREDSGTAVVWNPSIRKSVVVNVPNVLHRPYATDVGFAVCPITNDPKLVKIISYSVERNPFSSGGRPWLVEVYSLSSGVWRSLSINLPTERISVTGDQQVLEGVIYFLSIDRPFVGRVIDRPFVGPEFCLYQSNYVIMSFDTINEEFTKISLPECFHLDSETAVITSKLRESLLVMSYPTKYRHTVTDVWMMDHRGSKSFNRAFSIDPTDGYVKAVIGFRKSGEAMIMMRNISDDNTNGYISLYVYDLYSDTMDNTGISGKAYPFFSADCYTETLLLLDH